MKRHRLRLWLLCNFGPPLLVISGSLLSVSVGMRPPLQYWYTHLIGGKQVKSHANVTQW